MRNQVSHYRFWTKALLVVVVASGCAKDKKKPRDEPKTVPAERHNNTPKLPAQSYNYANPNFPEHFRVESESARNMQRAVLEEDNTPANNPTTDAGATLGRVLFYDENLGTNYVISCASCHKQSMGFSDDALRSIGFNGGLTGRHSMGLTNARFYKPGRFFWDQRAATLEDQVLMPFQDPVEMGMTLEGLVAEVERASFYPPLFEAAFGTKEVSSERIAKALAQFVRSMVSFSSKYDEGRAMVSARSEPFPNFSESENRGKTLFTTFPPEGGFGCFICHRGEAFVPERTRNNGLDQKNTDPGYGQVTAAPGDIGTFKVPSLRNVAMRPPYMHDGRFSSLSEVLDHYSDNVKAHPNLGPPFFIDNGSVTPLAMTDQDKRDIEAFLTTLNDLRFAKDPKFSNPFFPLPALED